MPPELRMRDTVRTDKWLWATRFFKTRSLATKAAAAGKIKRDGQPIKPATPLHVGDFLEVSFPEGPGARLVAVQRLIEIRVSAPLAQECYTDQTAPEVYEGLKEWMVHRKEAGGRPSKKDRRQIGRVHGFFE